MKGFCKKINYQNAIIDLYDFQETILFIVVVLNNNIRELNKSYTGSKLKSYHNMAKNQFGARIN